MGNCINFIKIDQGFQSIPLIGLSTLNRNKSRINLNSSKEQSWKKITVEDFKFLKILGQGSYGKIFLVQKKDSSIYIYLFNKYFFVIINTFNNLSKI